VRLAWFFKTTAKMCEEREASCIKVVR